MLDIRSLISVSVLCLNVIRALLYRPVLCEQKIKYMHQNIHIECSLRGVLTNSDSYKHLKEMLLIYPGANQESATIRPQDLSQAQNHKTPKPQNPKHQQQINEPKPERRICLGRIY